MKRTTIKKLLEQAESESEVQASGWIRTRRDSKNLSFIEVNDGSTGASLQVVVDHDGPCGGLLHQLQGGAGITATGILVPSPASGQKVELKAAAITIHGTVDPETYPLQKKRHSFEFLREIAHLRPRAATFGAVNRVRNGMARAIHEFFQERDFLYVQTPIITASDCEGAGELFKVTTLDKLPVNGDWSEDFFGTRTGLTVSGQLEGELLALALGNIYTFGPTFRAENSNTSRHLAEFWMVEPEMAFADLQDNMETAEALVRRLFREMAENNAGDLAFFDERIKPGLAAELHRLAESPFHVITYTEAVTVCEKSGRSFQYPLSWGLDLQSEHERYLTEEHFNAPVFVIDYPASIKPFYMKVNDDEKTVRAMDLLVPGVGEVIGGSQREDRLEVLCARMKSAGINSDDYSWYLDSRKHGSVPHSGFGLGFERIIQFVTGMQNIRDVIPFPRTPKNARF